MSDTITPVPHGSTGPAATPTVDGTMQGPAGPAAPTGTTEQNNAPQAVDIGSLSLEECDRILSGGDLPQPTPPPQPEAAEPPTPEQEPPVEQEAQPQPEGDTGQDYDGDNQPDATGRKKVRINLNSLPSDQIEVMRSIRDMVANGEASTVEEAVLKITGRNGTRQEPQAQAPKAGQGEDEARPQDGDQQGTRQEDQRQDPEIAGITQVIRELEDQRKQALEDFDNARALAIADKIIDAKLDMREALREQQSRRRQAEAFQQEQMQYIAQARERFPDLDDEGSLFHEMFAEAKSAALQNGDPVISRPDWAIELGKRIEGRIARLTGTATRPAAQAPVNGSPRAPSPPSAPARPHGQLAPTASARPPMSQEALQAALAKADIETLDRALSSPNPAAVLGLE